MSGRPVGASSKSHFGRGVGIEVVGVTKQFDSADPKKHSRLVGPITLTIAKGEFVAIVGRSGVGKTTLLNLIGGLTSPSSGCVSIDGASGSAGRRRCGFVFQEFSLFPWRTAVGNVEYGLEIRGVSKSERRELARNALERVNLLSSANLYPRSLSGGMKQRVAIARALAYESTTLLMDEPFSGLDEQTREELQDDLLSIWMATGKTTVFVTHDIREAVYLSNRVLVLGPDGSVSAHEVPLPYPRDARTRALPEVIELSQQIREAMSSTL